MVKLSMSSAYFCPVQAIVLYAVLSDNYQRRLGSCIRLGSHHMAIQVGNSCLVVDILRR